MQELSLSLISLLAQARKNSASKNILLLQTFVSPLLSLTSSLSGHCSYIRIVAPLTRQEILDIEAAGAKGSPSRLLSPQFRGYVTSLLTITLGIGMLLHLQGTMVGILRHHDGASS